MAHKREGQAREGKEATPPKNGSWSFFPIAFGRGSAAGWSFFPFAFGRGSSAGGAFFLLASAFR